MKFLFYVELLFLSLQNVLLRHPAKSAIKVIDFGSSCIEPDKSQSFILVQMPNTQSSYQFTLTFKVGFIVLPKSFLEWITAWLSTCGALVVF